MTGVSDIRAAVDGRGTVTNIGYCSHGTTLEALVEVYYNEHVGEHNDPVEGDNVDADYDWDPQHNGVMYSVHL